MSSVLQPFGLLPDYNVAGLSRGLRFPASSNAAGTIQRNYDTAATFVKGQPVSLNASGQIVVTPSAAGAGSNTQIFGVFLGAQYVDVSGRLTESEWFSNSFATTVADPRVIFWIENDLQNTRFIIQIEAALASPFSNVVGQEFNFSTTSGRTPASYQSIGTESASSTLALQASPVASGSQGQVRVVDLARTVAYPAGSLGNNWNDAYPIVEVVIANTALNTPKTSQ